MKLVHRMFVGLPLAFLMAGAVLTPTPSLFAAEKAQAVEQGFVASKDGDKYHTSPCRMAKKIKSENRVVYASEAEARSAGKTPCAICKP